MRRISVEVYTHGDAAQASIVRAGVLEVRVRGRVPPATCLRNALAMFRQILSSERAIRKMTTDGKMPRLADGS